MVLCLELLLLGSVHGCKSIDVEARSLGKYHKHFFKDFVKSRPKRDHTGWLQRSNQKSTLVTLGLVCLQAGFNFPALQPRSTLLLVLTFGARQTHTKGSGTTLATATADMVSHCSSCFRLEQVARMNLPCWGGNLRGGTGLGGSGWDQF